MKENRPKRNHKNKEYRYEASELKRKPTYDNKFDPSRKNKNYYKNLFQ